MASVQQVNDQAAAEKNKAAVDEAVKEAKSSLAKNIADAKAAQHQLALVVGAMRNRSQQDLAFVRDHSWKGKFLVKPPMKIPGCGCGAFIHQGHTSHGCLQVIVGSKGAVVYQQDYCGVNHPGFLLAWYKPDSPDQPNKVYVKAGLIQDLPGDWDEIEKKLDASCDRSYSFDPKTGAMAYAEIKDECGKVALLGSVFDIIKPPQP